jgi:hypothetical protein
MIPIGAENVFNRPSMICPICTFMVDHVGLAPETMMEPLAHMAQVREGNFPAEIPDGISAAAIVRYRTACQGDVECAGYIPVPG